RQAIVLRRPPARAAEREHAGVLAGAVVEERTRLPALLRPVLELVFGRRRACEELLDGSQLVRRRAVRRAGDRDLARRQVVARPHERQRLIGFELERMKQASPASPASNTTAP